MTLKQMDIWEWMSIQGSSSGKTLRVPSVPMTARTSGSSSRKYAVSQTNQFAFLDLRGNGPMQDASWVTDGVWLGEQSITNFGEHPNADVESHLSEILEDRPHQRFFLSAKACAGILRRSEGRGQPLPPILQETLLWQMSVIDK